MRALVGRVTLALHRLAQRVGDKIWSGLVAGAFGNFGRRSVLARPCRLEGTQHIHIESSVWIGPGSWLQCVPHGATAELSIGERVTASGSLVLSAAHSITVEADVLFARNVYVSDHIHRYDDTSKPVHAQAVSKLAPVRIEEGAWLGQNVVVCPGVTIGRGAVIGAGSVVNSDIPAYSVAVGSPARVVKRFDDAETPRPDSPTEELASCPS